MGAVGECMVMGRAYLNKEYPPFLYSGKTINGFLPAFCYHDLPAEEFESHLHFLRENHYRTVSCTEAVERIRQPVPNSDHEVLLTFDDGLASVYEVVYPLLKKYQMKAVSYLVPAWIGQPGFVTWEQCREMYRSGTVDFQSHSQAHHKIVTEPVLETLWWRSDQKKIPWGIPGFDVKYVAKNPSVLPVLRGDSLFSGKAAKILPEAFWQECLQIDSKSSDDATMRGRYSEILKKYSADIAGKAGDSLMEWMADDLRVSKTRIEKELPGHTVCHFAFPWHVNSPAAWQALEKAGFSSGAVGIKGTDRSDPTKTGSVVKIYRVNSDFLPCLPGNERGTFMGTVLRKALRRFKKVNTYGAANSFIF